MTVTQVSQRESRRDFGVSHKTPTRPDPTRPTSNYPRSGFIMIVASVPRVAASPEPLEPGDEMMTAARQIPDADPIAHLDFTPEILCEAPHCVGDPSNPGDYLVEWTKPVIAHLTGVARWVLCRPCWDRGALDVAERDAPWMLRIVKVIR